MLVFESHSERSASGDLNNGSYYLELLVEELPEGSLLSFNLVKQNEPLVSFSSVDGKMLNGNNLAYEKFTKGDSLANLVNLEENSLKVFKNGSAVYTTELTETETLNFSVKFGAEHQLVSIVANPEIPEGYNLMASGFTKKAKKGITATCRSTHLR